MAKVTSIQRLLVTLTPEVVVCDLHLKDEPSGPAAVAALTSYGWPVLAMSGVANQEVVLDAIAAGAKGFVEKSEDAQGFVAAVSAVVRDGCHVSARLAGYLLSDLRRRPISTNEIRERHRLALQALAQGDTIEEIARDWNLSRSEILELIIGAVDAGRRRRRILRPSTEERDVMLLLCEGLPHQKIAELLTISPWTVTSRLKKIREKYCQLHPEVADDMHPSVAARLWAEELGMRRQGGPRGTLRAT